MTGEGTVCDVQPNQPLKRPENYLAVDGRRGATTEERRAVAGGGGARLAAVAAVDELIRRRALLAGTALARTALPLRAEGDGTDGMLLLRKTALPFEALRGRAALGGGGLPAGAALLLAGWPPYPAVRAATPATLDATDGRCTLHLPRAGPCVRLETGSRSSLRDFSRFSSASHATSVGEARPEPPRPSHAHGGDANR